MGKRILIIDDEPLIVESVSYNLKQEGYEVIAAGDGLAGLKLAESETVDLILLDLMLPGMNGLEVCRAIRQKSEVPIIMLTAKEGEVDQVLGLELGADDYLVKPFSPRELVARVRAILRRTREGPTPQDVVTIGDVEVDLRRREARQGGSVVALTTREFDLLAFLANNIGLALSRQQLLDGVWGADWYGDERTVDVHVAQLRKKLGHDLPLATVWGVGYRFG